MYYTFMYCSEFHAIINIVNRPNDTLAREFDANHEKYQSHFSLDRQGMHNNFFLLL